MGVNAAIDWLEKNRAGIFDSLAELVAIPSISTDDDHHDEIRRCSVAVQSQMVKAGFKTAEIIDHPNAFPYVFGEIPAPPGAPTLLMLSHYDVQPLNYLDQWQSDPWKLTRRDGRLFGRGSADDKGGVVAQIAAVKAWIESTGNCPVGIKLLVEGEEEIGSKNLLGLIQANPARFQGDALVVCDTENLANNLPCITYSLRGVVTLKVTVRSARFPSHSGMVGGTLADPALGLCQILGRLCWNRGPIPVQGMYDQVRPLTPAEKEACRRARMDEAAWRKDLGVLPGVSLTMETGKTIAEQTWRRPSISAIALEASSIKGASNQVLPTAEAILSCRIVPDQEPEKVVQALTRFLTQSPPWGMVVEVEPLGPPVKWWITKPEGPGFKAAMESLQLGFGAEPLAIGCGGTIGFVEPLEQLLGGVPSLLLGIEDPQSNAHAPNESLHEGDWYALIRSMIHLMDRYPKG